MKNRCYLHFHFLVQCVKVKEVKIMDKNWLYILTEVLKDLLNPWGWLNKPQKTEPLVRPLEPEELEED